MIDAAARRSERCKPSRALGGEAEKTMDVGASDAAVGTRRPFRLAIGEMADRAPGVGPDVSPMCIS